MAIGRLETEQDLQVFVQRLLPASQPIGAWTAIPALQNSWTADASPANPQYRIDPSTGVVEFRGQVSPGTTTDSTLIFTMLTGFRPVAECLFECIHRGGASPSSSFIRVGTDGAVACYGTASGIGGMNLAPIRYPTF